MHYKVIQYSSLFLILFISFVSCNTDDPSDNATRLRIQLTDAASLEIKELYIDIQSIEIMVADTLNREGEWVALPFSGGEYNLLKLMNGKSVQLVDQYFPAGGRLQKIRLMLGNNNRLLTTTNEIIPLELTTDRTEGIVIDNVDAELPSHIISSIVIDVNAALSVRESGGNYSFHPVARAFPEIRGGSLRGYVAPVEANAFIAVVQATDTFLTLPEADGMFMFTGLREGPCEIHVMANPLTHYRDTLLTDSIVQGKITEITPRPIQLRLSAP